MIKTIEAIIFIGLLVFSFFLGVRYSGTVKENISWLHTKADEELELPNLSDQSPDAGLVQGPDGETPPMDDLGENQGNMPPVPPTDSSQMQGEVNDGVEISEQPAIRRPKTARPELPRSNSEGRADDNMAPPPKQMR